MATFTHARGLALFVTVYKLVNYLLQLVQKRNQLHNVIAALCGGYFIFGVRNNVHEQVKKFFLRSNCIHLFRVEV